MYSRGLWSRSIPHQTRNAVSRTARQPKVTFSRNHSQLREPRDSRSDIKEHWKAREEKKDGKRQSQQSSLRPITVFAVCIPLGYALKWYLDYGNGARDGAGSDGFVKYNLTHKEDVSSTSSLFTLRPATATPISLADPSLERAITSVQFKQPQLQIARNYTILPRVEGQHPDELRFLIRREQNGEMSGYLHRLPVGAEIEARGVSAEYVLPAKVERVVFLAGGTGIAPAMQATQKLTNEAMVHILWASRKREDCLGGMSDLYGKSNGSWNLWSWWQKGPIEQRSQDKGFLVKELDLLQHRASSTPSSTDPAKVLVDFFVDEEGTFIQPKEVQRLLQDPEPQSVEQTSSGKKLIFVSGPEGFIKYWAGPKQWLDGREVQGRLSGVLASLDLEGWEVVKL